MGKDYFTFKQFTIHQGRCAMKVGTDGTLLGAWAQGGSRILDIGTGTGLVALMMAQRFPEAQIVGVEIDANAVEQAKENVAQSPFFRQIEVQCVDINSFESQYLFDSIVSNPPYFDNSLECPDDGRTRARHTSSLSYAELIAAVKRLLCDEGVFTVIIPSECRSKFECEAVLAGLFKVRECAIKTTLRKAPRRYLMAFAHHPSPLFVQEEGIIETQPDKRSEWYRLLTKDFYL